MVEETHSSCSCQTIKLLMRNYYAKIRDAEDRRLFIGAGNVQCIDDMMESIVLNWWYFPCWLFEFKDRFETIKENTGDIEI